MLKKVLIAVFVLVFAVLVFGETKKQQNVPPEKPLVTTWSKIKEMFE